MVSDHMGMASEFSLPCSPSLPKHSLLACVRAPSVLVFLC